MAGGIVTNIGVSNIKNVAIYTRVSTEDQAEEGFSLDAQLQKLQAYCKTQDWNIKHEYCDPGFSGRNERRPDYWKMLKDMDQWDAILVLKMDRIHRNAKNFMNMMELLQKKGKNFVSATESLDTSTAMGRFVMDIIQRIAQLESEQNGERVTIGMIQKHCDIDEHKWTGGRAPFGYRIIDHKLVPIPEKIKIVKKMFELYTLGHSIHKISEFLGQPYSRVRYRLQNIAYIGYSQWGNKFKLTDVEPVISLDLWNTVQIKRCKNMDVGDSKATPDQCPKCGGTTIHKSAKRYTKNGVKQRYKCNDCKHRFVVSPGGAHYIEPFLLDDQVPFFELTDQEMRKFGLWNHRLKHNMQ